MVDRVKFAEFIRSDVEQNKRFNLTQAEVTSLLQRYDAYADKVTKRPFDLSQPFHPEMILGLDEKSGSVTTEFLKRYEEASNDHAMLRIYYKMFAEINPELKTESEKPLELRQTRWQSFKVSVVRKAELLSATLSNLIGAKFALATFIAIGAVGLAMTVTGTALVATGVAAPVGFAVGGVGFCLLAAGGIGGLVTIKASGMDNVQLTDRLILRHGEWQRVPGYMAR